MFKYKLQWQETGGIKSSETAYSESTQYFSGRDIRPFNFGNDILIEPSTGGASDEEVVYDADDFAKDEPESLYEAENDDEESSTAPDLTPVIPPTVPATSPESDVSEPVTIVISRKNRKRKRRVCAPDVSQQRDEPPSKRRTGPPAPVIQPGATVFLKSGDRVYGVFETWTVNDKCLVKITGFCTNEHPYVDKYNHNDIGCFDVSELQVSFNNTTQQ